MTPQVAVSSVAAGELLKLDNQLCFAMYATSRAITNLYRPALAKLNLTYPQYLVMLVLWEGDGISIGELGERLYLDSGTLTPLLKRLERQGLIIRRRDTEDERQVNISLTLAGARMKRSARSVAMTLKCRLQLPEDQVAGLRDELKAIMTAATQSEEKA